MKNLNVVKPFFLIFFLFGLLFSYNSCKNESDETEILSKEKISVSFSVELDNSRTIIPECDLNDSIKKVVLKVTKKGDAWASYYDWDSVSSMMNNSHVFLSEGTYSFELYLYTSDSEDSLCQKGVLKNILITQNSNRLRFKTEFVQGSGSFELNVNWSNSNVDKAVATLLQLDAETTVSGFESEQIYVNCYSKENVPSGNYYVKIILYDRDDNELYTYLDVIKIMSGLCTEKNISADNVNSICNIQYDLHGGSFIDGYKPAEYFDENGTVILPASDKLYQKYYTFIGWYLNGSAVETLSLKDFDNNTQKIRIEAKWKAHPRYVIDFGGKTSVSFYYDDEPYLVEKPTGFYLDKVEIVDWYTADYKIKFDYDYIDNENIDEFTWTYKEEYNENRLNLCPLLKVNYEDIRDILHNYSDSIRNYRILICSETATSFDTRIQASCGSFLPVYGNQWWNYIVTGSVGWCNSLDLTGMSKLEKIDDLAFCHCYGLTQIILPETVTTIGDGALGKTGIKEIVIPSSVKIIGENVFYATDLETVILKDGIECDLAGAFSWCEKLSEINIPNSITSIGAFAFQGCRGITEISIPNSVTSIGAYAFDGCYSLTNMSVPNSVESIGDGAFRSCSGLTELSIPNNVKTIGKNAFDWCSEIKEINVPAGITSIEDSTFENCRSITRISLPSSVTKIGKRAFVDCYGLTEINIPEKVTKIGDSAFSGCSGLTEINIPENVTSITKGAFYGCSGLTEISIPSSVASIGEEAFYGCSGLTEISIPSSVASIGEGAFSGCSGLTEINIPENVTSIGKGAFRSCVGLSDINIPIRVTTICENTYSGCTGLKVITIPTSITSIGKCAFSECTELTKVTIPTTVTSIDDGVFSGCSKLSEINIPNSITRIKGSTFSDCTALSELSLPNTITNIGDKAFSGCSKLSKLSMPNSIREIGTCAFKDCTGLAEITLSASINSIGGEAFSGCTSLTEIEIPNSVTSIGWSLFKGCTGLTKITIPNSVTTIDCYAFYGCSSLKKITIPSSVNEINYGAFTECEQLSSIYYEGTSSQWRLISNETEWHENCPVTKVICTDGEVAL